MGEFELSGDTGRERERSGKAKGEVGGQRSQCREMRVTPVVREEVVVAVVSTAEVLLEMAAVSRFVDFNWAPPINSTPDPRPCHLQFSTTN
ncbi:hypothetical protein M0R45_000036 [Rubus argutus]|uniref:Uncharacterized protein n=1 Tax=Rubus argutus TaxID=59490 RepID=A0AAW1VS47_RUBAR